MTNYERIKAMSVEEMQIFLKEWVLFITEKRPLLNIREWLESEVK